MDAADVRKVGIGLTGGGVVFSMLGVMFFFDRTLLSLGNVRRPPGGVAMFALALMSLAEPPPPRPRAQLLFVAGVFMIIGLKRTARFFFQRKKAKASVSFLLGIGLILLGWCFLGFIAEAWGFLSLFGDFFPVVIAFLRNTPIIGSLLQLPFVRAVTDKVVTKSRLPV